MPRAVLLLLPTLLAACPSGTVTVPNRRDAGVPVTGCQEACNATADCLQGYHCQARRCLPDIAPAPCNTHLECQGELSGWSQCVDDRSCPSNFACVGDASAGYCARKPTSTTPCTQTAQEEMTLAARAGTGNVTVCGVPRARCHPDGYCILGCASDGDCSGETPRCNTLTGVCGCTASSCNTNASSCVEGVCRCARDTDCRYNADRCTAGACGCSAVTACTLPRAHPTTTWVCE